MAKPTLKPAGAATAATKITAVPTAAKPAAGLAVKKAAPAAMLKDITNSANEKTNKPVPAVPVAAKTTAVMTAAGAKTIAASKPTGAAAKPTADASGKAPAAKPSAVKPAAAGASKPALAAIKRPAAPAGGAAGASGSGGAGPSGVCAAAKPKPKTLPAPKKIAARTAVEDEDEEEGDQEMGEGGAAALDGTVAMEADYEGDDGAYYGSHSCTHAIHACHVGRGANTRGACSVTLMPMVCPPTPY